jgi:hypothetical protein
MAQQALPGIGTAWVDIGFGARQDMVIAGLEGRKIRRRDGSLSITDSPANLETLRRAFPGCRIILPARPGADLRDIPLGVYHSIGDPKPYAHQVQAVDWLAKVGNGALFMEQGTGKTKCGVDYAGKLYAEGRITGVFIATFKGLHRQWVMEQIPTHLGTIEREGRMHPIGLHAHSYEKKPVKWPYARQGLEWFTCNFESMYRGQGLKEVEAFYARHPGRVLFIVDESQAIKTAHTERAEACRHWGERSRFRVIMTGTPIPNTLEDEWAQLLFVDEAIFGMRYVSTFRARYTETKMVQGQVVSVPRNLEDFKARAAPHIFRVTKEECLDLPEKIYDRHYFAMGAKARAAYDDLKANFLHELEGETFTVQNAAVLMTRLRQITSGLLVNEDGSEVQLGDERAEALDALLNRFSEERKVLVWGAFRRDLDIAEARCAKFGQVVRLDGGVDDRDRMPIKQRFLEDDTVRYLVANPAVAGAGYNLQGECCTAIYFSNDWNSVNRQQSEDRLHRIGTRKKVILVDLVASRSIDSTILSNLKRKKSFSDLMLSDLRQLLTGEDAI